MFYNLYTPISYNTNFESVLSHYGFGFCGGSCNPFASLFNGYSTFGNIAYKYPLAYPTMCPDSYNLPPNIFTQSKSQNMSFGDLFRQALMPSRPQIFSSGVNPFSYSSASYAQASVPSFSAAMTETKKTQAAPEIHKSQNVPHSRISGAELRSEFVTTAQKYSNCSERNGGQHKFCINPTCKVVDAQDKEWCTDFVTYVVKETYRKNGKTPPAGFGDHDVKNMKNWANYKGYFIRTSNKPQKGEYIAQNIKQGDIVILNEHGASHTGFVTGVDDDGTIHTIEGNRDDKVTTYAYSPDYSYISGFIRMPA